MSLILQALAKATVEEDWNKLPAETQEMYVKMAEGTFSLAKSCKYQIRE